MGQDFAVGIASHPAVCRARSAGSPRSLASGTYRHLSGTFTSSVPRATALSRKQQRCHAHTAAHWPTYLCDGVGPPTLGRRIERVA